MMSLINLFATKAYAVGTGVDIPGGSGPNYTYNTYIDAILKYAISVGLALSTMMFVYAGIIYITSQGDSSKISTAKDIVTGTLIGLVMLIVMDSLVKFFVR